MRVYAPKKGRKYGATVLRQQYKIHYLFGTKGGKAGGDHVCATNTEKKNMHTTDLLSLASKRRLLIAILVAAPPAVNIDHSCAETGTDASVRNRQTAAKYAIQAFTTTKNRVVVQL